MLRPLNEPIGKIEPQDWMVAPQTQQVMAALCPEGGEARFVGGCVRDAIIKRPVKDVDIATIHLPETTVALLEKASIKVIPTGIAHGTVTALIDGHSFEITTLRLDLQSDGRRAKVAFSNDWVADAARRDFTINSMSASLEGDIYDPYGGMEDLAAGFIRFVGVADHRVEEDYLRILRYYRFLAHYGNRPYDADALAACRKYSPFLKELSGERIRAEVLRLLECNDPAFWLILMRGERVLGQILPEMDDFGSLRFLTWLETRAIKVEGVQCDALRRLGMTLKVTRAGLEDVCNRLRLSNAQALRLERMVFPDIEIDVSCEDDDISRALHRLGPDAVRDVLLLKWSQKLAVHSHLPRPETERWIAHLNHCAQWQPLDFPLKGRDVIDQGFGPGPEIGEILAEVQSMWEESGCKASRDECLAWLRLHIAGREKVRP